MVNRAFKSERHTALSQSFPAEGLPQLRSSQALDGPHRPTKRRRGALAWVFFALALASLAYLAITRGA